MNKKSYIENRKSKRFGSKDLLTLSPINRHITVVPHVTTNETNSGVLLPEDFELDKDKYISATVIAVAPDCAKYFQKFCRGEFEEKTIIIDRTMMEEVSIKNKTFYIILENYVLGHLRTLNEK